GAVKADILPAQIIRFDVEDVRLGGALLGPRGLGQGGDADEQQPTSGESDHGFHAQAHFLRVWNDRTSVEDAGRRLRNAMFFGVWRQRMASIPAPAGSSVASSGTTPRPSALAREVTAPELWEPVRRARPFSRRTRRKSRRPADERTGSARKARTLERSA